MNLLSDKLSAKDLITSKYCRPYVFITILFLVIPTVFAEDVIRIQKPHSDNDQRGIYFEVLLTEVLETTVPNYGEYRIERPFIAGGRKRALVEIISGQVLNVSIVPTQLEWEQKTIPIRIPLLKGLLGYRLFLIKRQDAKKFSDIKSLKELKNLNAGLHPQWSTTKAMRELGFKIVTGGADYEGLFLMLVGNRFDYFPRGVNEIFFEFDSRTQNLPDMMIEPTKSLYLPLPYYIFVSSKYPRLAERIETGLRKMIQDGRFDDLFWEYNKSYILRANLPKRQVFSVKNPFLSPETPYDQESLWYDPLTE